MELNSNLNNELTIEPVNEELYDLESLITEGTDSFIPLKFVFPGTDKKVGVFIRPVLTKEFTDAANSPGFIISNLVKIALYDRNKKLFPAQVIDNLPAGVVIELYKKIADISGIPTKEQSSEEVVERMMGF